MQKRQYEIAISQDPSDSQAAMYLAMWHLERGSYLESKKYFSHLATIEPTNINVWLSLGISSALSGDLVDSERALFRAQEERAAAATAGERVGTANNENGVTSAADVPVNLSDIDLAKKDVRILFCEGLILEKQKDFLPAVEKYNICNLLCKDTIGDLDLQMKVMKDLSQVYATDLEAYRYDF